MDPDRPIATVLLDSGPKWAFTVRFISFGSKLVVYGPFSWFRARIGHLQSVLPVLGPNRWITARFTSFGTKMVVYGPFY